MKLVNGKECCLKNLSCPHTAVYLQFGGMNLPTNGFVSISQLGNSPDTRLVCSTDQSGDGAAVWQSPDGTTLSSTSTEGFFVSDGSDGVYLLRGSGIPVEGIYTCIATDSSGNTRMVFVGLYNMQGGTQAALVMNWFLCVCVTGEVSIDGEVQFALDSDPTAEPPEFTLTCISIEGPATSVVWTRNNQPVTEGTKTQLNDQVTARYTHTLTVTGRLGGDYVCNVSNSISSTLSRELNIKGV